MVFQGGLHTACKLRLTALWRPQPFVLSVSVHELIHWMAPSDNRHQAGCVRLFASSGLPGTAFRRIFSFQHDASNKPADRHRAPRVGDRRWLQPLLSGLRFQPAISTERLLYLGCGAVSCLLWLERV